MNIRSDLGTEIQVEEVIGGVLLPGMLLTGAVPAVACEIYGALSALPYTRRYRLYNELRVRVRLPLLCWAIVLVHAVECIVGDSASCRADMRVGCQTQQC